VVKLNSQLMYDCM